MADAPGYLCNPTVPTIVLFLYKVTLDGNFTEIYKITDNNHILVLMDFAVFGLTGSGNQDRKPAFTFYIVLLLLLLLLLLFLSLVIGDVEGPKN